MLKVLVKTKAYTQISQKKIHFLFCKPKDRAATEDNNKIVYENDCSICEAMHLYYLNGL